MFQGRKVLTLLVSLLAAALLWLYVITTVAPEMNVRISNIPVTVDGNMVLDERGLVITNVATESISLELNTSRANLSKLSAASIRISADASRIREAGDYDLNYTITFPDTVKNNDVDILRKSSNTVRVTVSKVVTKPVPVRLDWSGSVKEGLLFESEGILLDPAEIVVEGPDYEVEAVKEAVASYDVSGLEQTESVVLPLTLLDTDGQEVQLSEFTTVSQQDVTATLPVVQTRELKLVVKLVSGGGVMEENAQVEIDPDTIRVKGSAEALSGLEDTLEIGSVDLSAILDEEHYTFNITLQKGVVNMSGETEANVTVKLTDVKTDTITVSDIRLINAPEGFETSVTTRKVTVTLRGAPGEIEEIQADSNNGFYILVDAGDYNGTGEYGLTGRVVNEKHPNVGIVGAPEVNIVISQPTEETGEEDAGS